MFIDSQHKKPAPLTAESKYYGNRDSELSLHDSDLDDDLSETDLGGLQSTDFSLSAQGKLKKTLGEWEMPASLLK